MKHVLHFRNCSAVFSHFLCGASTQNRTIHDSSTSKHQNPLLQPGPRHVAAEGMEVTSCGRCWPGLLLLEVMGCDIFILILILGYEKITALLIRWRWIVFFISFPFVSTSWFQTSQFDLKWFSSNHSKG